MKKKILAVSSALVMAFTLSVGVLPEGLTNVLGANTISASALQSGDYEYIILGDGTAQITGYTGSATDLTIPSTIGGKAVTSISVSAFHNYTNITSVAIPEGVTFVEFGTFFGCTSLTDVTIPASVSILSSGAFCDCPNITNITVDADNPKYSDSDGVLYDKTKSTLVYYPVNRDANTYTIPNSVTTIINMAFFDCQHIANVVVPNSVTQIETNAFMNCPRLTNISISADNPIYSDLNGVLFNKNKTQLLCYPDGKADNQYTIPSSVTSIGSDAFDDCANLKTITIPASIKTIPNYSIGYNNEFSTDGIVAGINKIKNNSIAIQGYATSAAQKYASVNGLPFQLITVAPSSMRTVSATYNSVKIAWASVYGASGYEVWRSDTFNGKNTLVGDVKTNYFTNINLTRTTAYYYKVRTYYIVGGAKVYSDFTTLAAKTNFEAPAPITSLGRTTSSIKFGWPAVVGASGYEVYRSNTSSGTYALIGTVTTNSFNNTRLTRKANYYYKVRAYRFVGKTKVYSNFGTFYAAVKA